ncbi:MAG: fibronectin type III domain-containing protein [Chitinophagales bacterium]|nr:fibronectin type III domain-containing protein [Chitinophagales bacterium]
MTFSSNVFETDYSTALIQGINLNYFTLKSNNLNCNVENGSGDLYLFEAGSTPINLDFDATNNWWGTNDSIEVADEIYDYFDNLQTGVVDYNPFLNEPDITAPVSPVCEFVKVDLGGGTIQFNWSRNKESDITGYRIYWDTLNSFSFSNFIDVGNDTTVTLSNLDFNKIYAITAHDNNSLTGGMPDQLNGFESWYTYVTTKVSTLLLHLTMLS